MQTNNKSLQFIKFVKLNKLLILKKRLLNKY